MKSYAKFSGFVIHISPKHCVVVFISVVRSAKENRESGDDVVLSGVRTIPTASVPYVGHSACYWFNDGNSLMSQRM